jgi:hypothetical protein
MTGFTTGCANETLSVPSPLQVPVVVQESTTVVTVWDGVVAATAGVK